MGTFGTDLLVLSISLVVGLLVWRMVVPAILVATGVLDPARIGRPDGPQKALRAALVAAGLWTAACGGIALALWLSPGHRSECFAALGVAMVPVLVIPNLVRVVKRHEVRQDAAKP